MSPALFKGETLTQHLFPQLLQELRDPTLTFRLLGSPRYELGKGGLLMWRGHLEVSPATCICGLDILSPGLPASIDPF